jgi:transcription-repair coupling factor (superfamily II helicase)
MARAARQPVIVLVADNKAAEALEPMLRAGCELTGAIDPAEVVRLPAHDVLPLKILSLIRMCRSSAPPRCGSSPQELCPF